MRSTNSLDPVLHAAAALVAWWAIGCGGDAPAAVADDLGTAAQDLASRPDLTTEPVASGHIAVIGATCTSEVDVAPILGPGTLGAWRSQPDYPLSFGEAGVAVVGGCVFAVGGFVCSGVPGMGAPTDAAYGAHLANGAIGPWSAAARLPMAASLLHLVEDGGFLVALPGVRSMSTVYRASVDATTCSLGSWEALASLPAARDYVRYVEAGGHLYALSGSVDGKVTTDVAYAPLSGGAPGAFVATTPLPSPGRWLHAAVTDGKYVYVLGGRDDFAESDAIFAAPIGLDHALGTWKQLDRTLPARLYDFDAVVVGGHLYVTAGVNPGYLPSVWSAPIGDGAVGPFAPQPDLPAYRNGQRMVAY